MQNSTTNGQASSSLLHSSIWEKSFRANWISPISGAEVLSWLAIAFMLANCFSFCNSWEGTTGLSLVTKTKKRPKKVYQKSNYLFFIFFICKSDKVTKVQSVLKTDQGADVSAHAFFSGLFFAVCGQIQLPIGLITFFFCSTHLRTFVLFVLSAHNSCFITKTKAIKTFLLLEIK